eukprot:g3022.t1
MTKRLVFFLLAILWTVAKGDWVNEMRLTLANYALSKAAYTPDGFVCAQKGTKHDSCHCWNEKGHPASSQTDDDCHMPPQCLAYSVTNDGGFNFTSLADPKDLDHVLGSWGVPSEMYSAFEAASLVESATFGAFEFSVKTGDKGSVQAFVGTCRKFNGTVQVGWTFGNSEGNLVQPYKRDTHEVPAGDCHGTTRGMKKRGYTTDEITFLNDALLSYAFKKAATKAQPTMTEDLFLEKWKSHVSVATVDDALSNLSPRLAVGENPFDLLMEAIQKITSAWQSIVSAFGSKYEEQLLESHLNNGWAEFKEATKVFKGAGLAYSDMDSFFADIRGMVGIPDEYKDDFDNQIQWIKFFDNTTWSEHDTQFSSGTGGSDKIFTMYANNHLDEHKVDVLFLTCEQEFKLADDYFVISEHKSILGGLFDSTKIKFKKKPAAISDADLMFVSEYFSLLAYQQIALAEGVAAPPDPSFPQLLY